MIYKCNKAHSVCRLGFYSDRLLIADRAGPQAAASVVPSPCRFMSGASHLVAVVTAQRRFGDITLEGCLMLHNYAGMTSQGKIVRHQCPCMTVGSSDMAG